MTTLGVNGDVSVDDRAAECLAAIAAIYEDGIAHVAFLSRAWDAPPAPSAPVLLAAALAEPVVPAPVQQPAEPAVAPDAAVAEEPAAPEPVVVLLADEPAMLPMDVVADAPTATDLPVATVGEPATELLGIGDVEAVEPGRVLVFAEAATAEIPVQAAA